MNYRQHSLFIIIGLLLLGITQVVVPSNLDRMTDKQKKENPQNCQYYISLKSELANYPLLANDSANLTYIKSRISDFEKEISHSTASPEIIAPYQKNYAKILKRFNLTNIEEKQDESTLLEVAETIAPVMDDYYLNTKLFCTSPLYHYDYKTAQRHILPHNLSELYTHIPSRFSTIMVAEEIGPQPGLFITNQTTTLDTRFLTGMPLLSALYLLPKFNYLNVGDYGSPMPMNYFKGDSFSDPITRKTMDVGGIDIFTLSQSELGDRPIPDTVPLASEIHSIFDYDQFKSFINTSSYGMAYLANQIQYEDPDSIAPYEKKIKHYFLKHTNPEEFVAITGELYKKLMTLKNKYDIILESDTKIPSSTTPPGSIEIKGVVGERTLFTTHCARESCELVYNLADAPGWHAFVNNTAAVISRANFSFMAVTVPRGDSNVWFIYDAFSHRLGDFLSMLTLIAIAILTIRRRLS